MKRISIAFSADSEPVAEVTELLNRRQINIEEFDFNKFGSTACLSLTVDDYARALSVLIEEGYSAFSSELVLINAQNRVGELAEISKILLDNGVGIRSLSIMHIGSETYAIAMVTTDNELARTIFADVLVN